MENSKDFKFSIWLLIIGAILGAVPTIIVTYINNVGEDHRILDQSIVVRKDIEIREDKILLDEFIQEYGDFKSESNVILKNLVHANILSSEDFEAPGLNKNNFMLDEVHLHQKIENLSEVIYPSLRKKYFQLTAIHRIPLPEDVIAVINGMNIIILFWGQHNKAKPPFHINTISIATPHWYPDHNTVIPPTNFEVFFNKCMSRLDQEIKVLTDIRMNLINGTYL